MFAQRTGIDTSTVSLLRQGKRLIWNYADKILSAFPGLSFAWLLTGVGSPESEITCEDSYDEMLRLQKKVDYLEKQLADKQKIIEALEESLALYRELHRKKK